MRIIIGSLKLKLVHKCVSQHMYMHKSQNLYKDTRNNCNVTKICLFNAHSVKEN